MNEEKISNLICGSLWVLGVVFGILYFFIEFDGSSKSSSDSPSGRPAGMSESDHNYVNGRFRQEGFNAKEAEEATRAVNSFNQAQQQRKGR